MEDREPTDKELEDTEYYIQTILINEDLFRYFDREQIRLSGVNVKPKEKQNSSTQ